MAEQDRISVTVSEASGADRRIWVRYPSTPENPFFSIAEEDHIIFQKARVRDLSAGGVGLLMNDKFEPGTLVDVVLTNPAENTTHRMQAKVVHARPQPDGGWLIGCSFTAPISEENLKVFC